MSLLLGEINVNIRADNSRFNADLDTAENRGRRFSGDLSNNVLNLSQQIGEAGRSIGTNFSKVGGVMQAAGQSIQSVGASLTKYITLPLAAAGVAIFKFGKDFEYELSKVVGLVGVSRDQVSAWGDEILDLAPKIGRPPKELAEALFFVTSAGIKGAEAMDILEASGKAAAVGMGETKTIADLVTSAMNAYGKENLSAAQAVDIITNAVREGKAEASEMASSMGQVLPLATEMGVSFDQVAAAQAAMTRTGTNASEAATHLKSIFAGMLKPAKQAEEQLKAMGTSSSEMRRKIREDGLLSALTDLRNMTNKYGEEAMARVYPNIRALIGVLDLMGANSKENAVIFEHLADSTGILDEAFQSASETLDFKWNQAISKVQATAISFFDILRARLIPVLETVIRVLDFVVEKFQGLSEPIQNAILSFAGIAFIIGPIVLGLGTAIVMLGSTIAAVGTIITVVSSIIATVGIPVILAIVAAAYIVVDSLLVLIGTFVLLWKTNEEFRTKVLDTWNSIKENGKIIFEELKTTIIYIFNAIQEFWSKHGEDISSILGAAWDDILDIIKFATESIKNVVLLFGAVIKGDWGGIWEALKGQLFNILDVMNATVGEKFNSMAAIIMEKLGETKNQLKTDFDEMNETVGTKLNTMASVISEKFTTIKAQLKTDFEEMKTEISIWISELPERFREGFELVKSAIIEKFTETTESIKTKLEEWKISITEWFTNMPSVIKELLSAWGTAIVEWTIAQNEENRKQFTIWEDSIREWFLAIPGKISELLETWKTAIVEWFDGTKEKITEKLIGWWEGITVWFQEAPGKITAFFEAWWESIKKWFEDTGAKITGKLEGWWEGIKTWFQEAPGKITGFLDGWWSNMKKWFEETKTKITEKLNEWWKTIREWFVNVPNKPEIRRTGREMIVNLGNGTKDKKGDFTDKLGKLIVDVTLAALAFAGVALLATGREIVKRMIKGIGEVNLREAGQKIVQSLINGIKSKYSDVTKVVRELATKIRDFFPFSPAKEGPLKDLDKIDFFSSINKSLMNATSKLDLPSLKLGAQIMDNLNQTPSFDRAASFGTAANAININGAMNFYGVEDIPTFMQEMRTTIKRYGGKFI